MSVRHVHFAHDVSAIPATPSPTYSSSSLPSSYGPMTPPQQYPAYLPFGSPAPSVAMHPALTYGPGRVPGFYFDVSLAPENIRPAPDSAVSGQAATYPPTASIVLTHERLPWDIIISPAQGNEVTVGSLLRGIYTALRAPVTSADYDALPSRSAQTEVNNAFARRCQHFAGAPTYSVERNKGLKRVDFLGALVVFSGLVQSQRRPNCWEILLSPAPPQRS
ncbi:hypothetical protein B0H15DRAFT_814816 [Mycena belliarum]|uniref:DUF6699 domain-containing protein n=1 Tax=Mycena belliarum TaxID=1033014 RepID=A0AAD6UIJ5_9AGAR|nr:hypothetical protein B0H15DRAFT_814816 [Mycena belliae]